MSMTNGHTPEQDLLQKLLRPFAPQAHQTLKAGNRGSFPYLGEEWLCARLNEVAPCAWGFELRNWTHAADRVGVTGVLTINGVSRANRGEAPTSDSEPEKSAATDAFKRACRLWGLGQYLLFMPKTDPDRFKAEDYAKAAQRAGWKGAVRT